jgi:hypothetical protein
MTIHELTLGQRLPVGSGEPFTKPIFFGCEDCRDEVDRAHVQLDEAFSYTSGLQQPSHCESEDAQRASDKADEEAWDRVRDLARSLVHALGVSEILK